MACFPNATAGFVCRLIGVQLLSALVLILVVLMLGVVVLESSFPCLTAMPMPAPLPTERP